MKKYLSHTAQFCLQPYLSYPGHVFLYLLDTLDWLTIANLQTCPSPRGREVCFVPDVLIYPVPLLAGLPFIFWN